MMATCLHLHLDTRAPAFMAAASWARFRRGGSAAMARPLLQLMPLFKDPGVVWAVTFVPFLACLIQPSRREVAAPGAA
jgi:hypothetical protein